MQASPEIHEHRRGNADQLAARIVGHVKRIKSLTRAERELDGLDDRLLADIGLRRSEIHQMVWGRRTR